MQVALTGGALGIFVTIALTWMVMSWVSILPVLELCPAQRTQTLTLTVLPFTTPVLEPEVNLFFQNKPTLTLPALTRNRTLTLEPDSVQLSLAVIAFVRQNLIPLP